MLYPNVCNRKFPLVITIILSIIIQTGCGIIHPPPASGPKPGQVVGEPTGQAAPADSFDGTGSLTIWSYYDLDTMDKELIQAHYPNLFVTYRIVPVDQAVRTYLQSYSENSVDLFILKDTWLGQFNEVDLFEDLSGAPYKGDRLLKDFPEAMRLTYRSFEGSKLLALPLEAEPMVTFYRHDILQQAGLPSEPEELADYMKEPEHWLKLALTLKKRNHWIIPWESEPLSLVLSGSPVFGRSMDYRFDRLRLTQALQLGKMVEKLGLASFSNIYVDSGRMDIKENKTVMFYASADYAEELKQLAPAMEGRWRMTSLPLDQHALGYQDLLAISSRSKNKAAAWAVAELLTEKHRNVMETLSHLSFFEGFDPGDPYFGGQKTKLLEYQVYHRLQERKLSPLDEKAKELVWQMWKDNFYLPSFSAQELAYMMEERITTELQEELQSLREVLLNFEQ